MITKRQINILSNIFRISALIILIIVLIIK
nr:MAG TPA_asm: Oligosaccaryltransferase [Caudoviricetes sp.]